MTRKEKGLMRKGIYCLMVLMALFAVPCVAKEYDIGVRSIIVSDIVEEHFLVRNFRFYNPNSKRQEDFFCLEISFENSPKYDQKGNFKIRFYHRDQQYGHQAPIKAPKVVGPRDNQTIEYVDYAHKSPDFKKLDDGSIYVSLRTCAAESWHVAEVTWTKDEPLKEEWME